MRTLGFAACLILGLGTAAEAVTCTYVTAGADVFATEIGGTGQYELGTGEGGIWSPYSFEYDGPLVGTIEVDHFDDLTFSGYRGTLTFSAPGVLEAWDFSFFDLSTSVKTTSESRAEDFLNLGLVGQWDAFETWSWEPTDFGLGTRQGRWEFDMLSAPIPLPGLLLASGLVLLGGLRWRKQYKETAFGSKRTKPGERPSAPSGGQTRGSANE